MSEQPIKSGRYSPDQTVELIVWNEGEDAPEGFDVIRTSDGSRVAVQNERGEVKRDADGNAYAMPEGGALAVSPDGSVQTLAGDDLNDFVKRYKPEGSTDSPVNNSGSDSTSNDSAAAAADAAAANPVTTNQTGVTAPTNTGDTTDAANANDANPAPATEAPSGDGTSAGGDAGTGAF